ncbi:hypothetical protein C7S20_01740 [Christiangramia fulva]|uniref:Beta-lactamase class A catalytic domain-containing protein n=1 Tax=Christiangramia fulva TaxID=2126553 RepID=A0A2R3Z1E3_9FLAO|nr:serine hydrolase [Christiangramia fulva]AVR44083.1 hypothetical protein C7S20_01740 [Christiangramia fulva]
MRLNIISFLFVIFLFPLVFSCGQQRDLLKKVRESKDPRLNKVFDKPEKYAVQIIYTEICHKNDEVSLKDYKYRVDSENYFYPASTVKLPVAALSLEKLDSLQGQGVDIYRSTPYHLEGDMVKHSIENDIKGVFAISDNEAYNRLFEFLGPDYINSHMKSKGLLPFRISHRFSGENSADTVTKQLIFNTKEGKYRLPVTYNQTADSLELKNVIIGKAYIKDDEQINEPFSFAYKNYFPLETQHALMKRLFFPEKFEKSELFHLSAGNMKFLKAAMSGLPRQLGYDENEFYDSYGKFFIYGDSEDRIPDYIKIYNKVGYAYGNLTETAYVHDLKNNVEFLLSATLRVNENEIYNDGKYEYDSIGIPFLAALGRKIYQLELERKK